LEIGFVFAALALVLVSAVCAANADASPNALHYRPETGVLGDTIPFYWDGTYHVYYLKGSGWGHIAGRNLVHWEQRPDALAKGSDRLSPDGENCWTGSIVEHGGIFHLFYTGKNSADPKGDQKVMHATSPDLDAWTKQPEDTFYADGIIYWSKPVNGAIDDKLIYHHQAFRDPEVSWNRHEGRWQLLLHAALADGSSPAIARYTSDDLVHWSPCKPLLVCPTTLSCDCPHLFETNGRWYLIAADRHYTWAAPPAEPFFTRMLPYDCGELFVPKTMFDGKQRILLGWIGDREGGRDSGQGRWGGVMCMPRDLYADAQGRLCQRPARQVLDAYGKTVLSLPEGPPLGREMDVPSDYLLHCRLKAVTPTETAQISFRANAATPSSGYRLKIGFTDKKITLGDPYRAYERFCDFDPGAPMDVKAFVEDTVIECFVNDAWCFTMRANDARGGSLRIDAPAGALRFQSFSVKTRQ